MIFRHIFILLVMVFCIQWADRAHAQSDQSSPSKIEIYVSGQQYLSFQDYQRSKLRETLKEEISKFQGSDWDQFVENVIVNLSREYFNDFDKDEITSMLNDLRAGMFPKARTVKRSRKLIEMEDMLEDYKKDHEDVNDLELDLENMKTIIIPSEEEWESDVLVDDQFEDDVRDEWEPPQEDEEVENEDDEYLDESEDDMDESDEYMEESDDYDDDTYEMEDDEAEQNI